VQDRRKAVAISGPWRKHDVLTRENKSWHTLRLGARSGDGDMLPRRIIFQYRLVKPLAVFTMPHVVETNSQSFQKATAALVHARSAPRQQ